ncbi:FAD dependent oxidoreductase [Daldinia caldariorum]|uniref:FAD dependent oxidoreductase n=1 Tax=Daldinia caldariorum TaxID=326644 RepID=UPI0020075F51|nr:FAD dependent oxidoreductase [Daldinia caldariorum]KAI1464065.1 FAD dependent oxidoreductase [Daldinia caldariorum]
MPHTVVLGAGVIGLSSALRIQAEGHAVTIVARDFPSGSETIDAQSQINYTSPWGGAHNRIVPPTNPAEETEHAMSLRTFDHMRAVQARHPEAGITFMKGIEYLEAPSEAYRTLTEERARTQLGIKGFRVLKEAELPEGVKWGCEYETWCVNPMVYCSFLLRRFAILGGKVLRREVRDPREIFSWKFEAGPVDVLINASGHGFGDDNMFITRGQTCLVANACPVTVTRQNADGSWTFCVPRNFDGGTIIGGTKEANNWDPNPSLEVRETLLRKFAATYPQILGSEGKFTVMKDIVGRRPTRKGGMRLEKEEVVDRQTIIHAYGLGGRGYELSWGVADGVARLLAEHLGADAWRKGEAKL